MIHRNHFERSELVQINFIKFTATKTKLFLYSGLID